MCDSDTTTAADELVDGAQGISLDSGDHNDATAPIRCLVASTAAQAASGRTPKKIIYFLQEVSGQYNVLRKAGF